MSRSCENCGRSLAGKSVQAKFCGDLCRKAAFNARHAGVPDRPADLATAAQVRRELEAVGRLETYLGASALKLAERIDSATAVMGFAALVKQLQATMTAAMDGVVQVADPVDEVKARRDRKLGTG